MARYGKPDPQHDPEWMKRGACKGEPTTTFFFEDTSPNHRARHLCLRCPVRLDCLEYATENEKDWGVWAGVTARVRLTLRRLMNRTSTNSVEELLATKSDVVLKMYPAPLRQRRRSPDKLTPVSTNEMFVSLVEAAKVRRQSKL